MEVEAPSGSAPIRCLEPAIDTDLPQEATDHFLCAGPLQYGVGRPDGANTMIKTIQYLAEADNSRVLVALDLKAASQNVSRRAMLYSIAQTDADLAAVFSKWYTGTTEHRMHYDSAHAKISANSGVDQGCPLSACGFSAVVDPVLRSVWRSFARITTQGARPSLARPSLAQTKCGTIKKGRVCVKASPAFGRRRLHTNTAYVRHPGFNGPSCGASPAEGRRCFT